MFISGVDLEQSGTTSQENEDIGEPHHVDNQVFEILETDGNFQLNEEFQTQNDLILIYKKINITNECPSDKPKRPNQYVETVIYDDANASDTESYSNEELNAVFKANNERLDLLDKSSHKFLFNNLRRINPSNDLAMEYQHLFKDPFIKDQLTNLNTLPSAFEFSTILPTSLLDFICAKGFDDNYNFYMENVISYVKHTIEQLKRISNGEFLTEKAKEKWLKVEGRMELSQNNMKLLESSSSEPKMTANLSKCNNVLHSEVNMRSLCKILEKKIIFNVPRMISGSFNVFQKDIRINSKVERMLEIVDSSPRLDVLVRIDNESKDVKNSNPIMIMQVKDNVERNCTELSVQSNAVTKSFSIAVTEPIFIDSLPFIEEQQTYISTKSNISIVELTDSDEYSESNNVFEAVKEEESTTDEYLDIGEESVSESLRSSEVEVTYSDSTKDVEGSPIAISPYELSLSMHKLNIQNPLPEEVEEIPPKRKSPTRVRIKSPYENKSYILEEKKRKKLLEIRQRREKNKLAAIENSKVKKQRPSKASVMPHASSSVTRLSITNKAFYNSIYGQNINSNKVKVKSKKELNLQIPNNSEEEDDIDKLPLSSAEHDKIKYVNRSYYLDDAVTEVEMNGNVTKEIFSASSAISTNCSDGINDFLDRLPLTPTDDNSYAIPVEAVRVEPKPEIKPSEDDVIYEKPSRNVAFSESANEEQKPKRVDNKKILPLECRKSIDRIYDLLKKISESDTSVQRNSKSEDTEPESSIAIASDSGTSIKHRLTSNASSYSFANSTSRKKWETPSALVPKVIINSKPKMDPKLKESRKKPTPADNIKTIKDNPLKAISQLLHDIDNVQKNRQKSAQESRLKPIRKIEAGDSKGVQRQVSFRKTDLKEPKSSPERRVPTPKKPKSPLLIEEKLLEKTRKRLTDLSDEVREARGEAVKGPKNFVRLNALAQPKKSYIQAHSEEIKSRYGRSIVTERLQRLVETPAPVVDKQIAPSNRKPRKAFENISAVKAASASPLGSPGRRAPGSPERRTKTTLDCGDVNKKPVVKRTRSRRSSPELTLPGARPARMSRVPLIPDDEIESIRSPSPQEDSTKLGDRLHQIMNRALMITNRQTPQTENVEVRKSISKDLFIIKETVSTTQDFPVNAFSDRIITAVEAISDVNVAVEDVKAKNKLDTKSIVDLQQLENALYSQMYSGAFQKRLRIKNFTLTPKHSMQQIVFLQSGDAGTVFTKPVKLSVSKSDTVADLKSVLSKPRLDILANIPMQVTTVGYAFSRFDKDNKKKKIIEVTDDVDTEPKDGQVKQEVKQTPKDAKVKEEVQQTSQGSQVNSESISDLSIKVNADSCLNEVKSELTFTKNVDEKTEIKDGIFPVDETKKDKEQAVENFVQNNNEKVACTSSLDILVSLLSEIQNITTNQTDLTKQASCEDLTKGTETKVFENNVRDVVSMTSLEQIRQLDSSPSRYSFYLSSDDQREIRRVKMLVPYYEDKGVSVDVRRELVNNFTDVPSVLFPVMCRSTNISDSLFGILKKSSSHSAFALTDYEKLYSNVLLKTESISEVKDEESDFSQSSIVVSSSEVMEEVETAENVKENNDKIKIIKTETVLVEPKVVEEKINEKELIGVAHDFTPVMKAKRDILVTVYSLLVLTVFAALSFPGVVYQSA